MTSNGHINESQEMLALQEILQACGGSSSTDKLTNASEKIIFVIDTVTDSKDESGTPAEVGLSTLQTIKRTIDIFFQNKLIFNKYHEFALVALKCREAIWHSDFSNNIDKLLPSLEAIKETNQNSPQPYFDLLQTFELINQKLASLNIDLTTNAVRVIFIYARSNTVPKFKETKKEVLALMRNSHFVVDLLYVHDPPSDDNKCQEIYTELIKLLGKKKSYTREVCKKDPKTMHDFMAHLLAHSMQRLPQSQFKVMSIDELLEKLELLQ